MILIGWTQSYEAEQPRGEHYRSEQIEIDSAGRTVRETHYQSGGAVNDERLIHYDANDRKRETVVRGAGGDLLGTWIARYDEQGRLAAETYRNVRGETEVEDRYEYLPNQTVVKTRGNVARWTQTYDRQGRLRSSRGGYYSADAADDVVLEYDDDGRLLRKTESSKPGVIARVTTYERL
ncbi:MAG: hypothetical protein ACXW5U_10655 [Thermoanaerobaculia bacterium]